MKTKRKTHRIVYKYTEVPRQTTTSPNEVSDSRSPHGSLAYRAWVDCYQPQRVHFELPSPASSEPAFSNSTASSSRSGSTAGSHSRASSTSSHGCVTNLPPIHSSPPTRNVQPPTLSLKTRAYSSPAILEASSTRPSESHTSSPVPSSMPSRSSGRSLGTSYITTSTFKTKDGAHVKEHKIVSSYGFQDSKGAVQWSVTRSPDWAYPLQQKVKGKKVLASYPHCQRW